MSKKRKIYALQMSYSVSDEEKEQAEKALAYFDFLIKQMKQADEHLDLLYVPFKDDTSNLGPEQIWKARAALRKFRDTVVENFNKFKRISFKCFALMQPFSSDTQVVKLNKSFVLCIADIEKQVNRFVDLFSNLKANDFGTLVIKAIENIKKELSQIDEIVDQRIKDYIENNILARTWVDSVSEELQQKIEERIPESVRLVELRDKGNK